MARKDKVLNSVKNFLAGMNPFKVHYPDVLYIYVSVFSILLMVVDLVLCGVDAFRLYSGMAGFYSSAYIPWLIVNILFFYGVSFIETCVSISHKDDEWKSEGPFYLHAAYIMCLIISLLVLWDATLKKSKTSPVMQDLWAAGICLIFLAIVEMTTVVLFLSDWFFADSLSEKEKKERDPAGRWWIRTVPYAILGMIFLVIFVSAILFGIGGAGYSMFYSVAVSVMAVNYLMQIINERIVPKEGPYRKTHPAAFADQPQPSSPSAGRGEGAC
ncbi:hypothetical protein JNUCC75_05380 [Bifidobacterium polysaccharolyticum]